MASAVLFRDVKVPKIQGVNAATRSRVGRLAIVAAIVTKNGTSALTKSRKFKHFEAILSRKREHFNVIVIGGGPAGISAAFWCAELGLSVAIFEDKSEFGGQLLRTFGSIQNYLGVSVNNGRELRDVFVQQLDSHRVTRFLDCRIESLDLAAKVIRITGGRTFSADAVVLATGVKRRTLGVPGELEFRGKGILGSGQDARQHVSGKRVVIIGGGDAALENALILSETAKSVTVVHRRDRFSARAEFVGRAEARTNVEFRFSSAVTAITGDERVTAVDVIDLATGITTHIDADHVLIRIGVEPNSGLFSGQIGLDERNYVLVNADCSTSANGVFAVGDVACPVSPAIATAVGMGATAAKAITARLAKDRA